jgi:hypothetical protein
MKHVDPANESSEDCRGGATTVMEHGQEVSAEGAVRARYRRQVSIGCLFQTSQSKSRA